MLFYLTFDDSAAAAKKGPALGVHELSKASNEPATAVLMSLKE
jgi:hypothetical protein